LIRSRHNLLIFPCFALTPASFDKSTQATSKQRVASSSLAGRATFSITYEHLANRGWGTIHDGPVSSSEDLCHVWEQANDCLDYLSAWRWEIVRAMA